MGIPWEGGGGLSTHFFFFAHTSTTQDKIGRTPLKGFQGLAFGRAGLTLGVPWGGTQRSKATHSR